MLRQRASRTPRRLFLCPAHARKMSGRSESRAFGCKSAYGLRTDYLAQMTCSAEEFAIPRRARNVARPKPHGTKWHRKRSQPNAAVLPKEALNTRRSAVASAPASCVQCRDKRGWEAILGTHKLQPFGPIASLYKASHHGSENAHNQGVWNNLLTANPLIRSDFNFCWSSRDSVGRGR